MNKLPKLYKSEQHRDLRELLIYAEKNFGDKDAFILKHKEGKNVSYEHITYTNFLEDVAHFSSYLTDIGCTGKKIALIGNNSYEWIVTYFATVCGIGTIVPLDKGLPYEEILSSVKQSGSEILVYDKIHDPMAEKLSSDNDHSIKEFISTENMKEYLDAGKSSFDNGNRSFYENSIDPDKLSIMIFTSGTTSKAKAVMLSHRNITSDIYGISSSIKGDTTDVNMAFLPFHHTLGATATMMMFHFGAVTTFCDGLKYLQKNLVEYGVSIFVCVPLLIEGIYKKM